MNDFFAPAIPAENVLSDRLRVHAVLGDAMEPTLRGGRDYALIAPVDTFKGDGLYVVDVGAGLGTDLYRVTNTLDRGRLRLSRDNPLYEAHDVDRDSFEAHVLGIVVADIKVRDEHMLRAVQEGGR